MLISLINPYTLHFLGNQKVYWQLQAMGCLLLRKQRNAKLFNIAQTTKS